MSGGGRLLRPDWRAFSVKLLPFADAASAALPLRRLLRLSLFQVSVGMATVLLTGALNRVMIVEIGVPAWLVALVVAIPLLAAPFRALMGHRSDQRRSALGWRRVPYLWFGALLQFGGLAIMPFALLVLSEPQAGREWVGLAGAAIAFLLVGSGVHLAQTAGLALAGDIATPDKRPKVVALLYVSLLVGMLVSALVFGLLLADYSPLRLIQTVQGAAVVALILNVVALWKQEARRPNRNQTTPRRRFRDAWSAYSADPRTMRLLVAAGLGAAGFGMQDVLLEPYGGEVLGMSVGRTTLLTALFAAGALAGFAAAARALTAQVDACRLAAGGALVGVFAFCAVVLAAPMGSAILFQLGATAIGFGGGLFAVGALTAAMDMADSADNGLALGAFGAVQAAGAGLGLALGGALRDAVNALAGDGALGGPALGYIVVYHLEIALLFATLAAIGPLARPGRVLSTTNGEAKFGLAEFPG